MEKVVTIPAESCSLRCTMGNTEKTASKCGEGRNQKSWMASEYLFFQAVGSHVSNTAGKKEIALAQKTKNPLPKLLIKRGKKPHRTTHCIYDFIISTQY